MSFNAIAISYKRKQYKNRFLIIRGGRMVRKIKKNEHLTRFSPLGTDTWLPRWRRIPVSRNVCYASSHRTMRFNVITLLIRLRMQRPRVYVFIYFFPLLSRDCDCDGGGSLETSPEGVVRFFNLVRTRARVTVL